VESFYESFDGNCNLGYVRKPNVLLRITTGPVGSGHNCRTELLRRGRGGESRTTRPPIGISECKYYEFAFFETEAKWVKATGAGFIQALREYFT
jgi:hypothetical protein